MDLAEKLKQMTASKLDQETQFIVDVVISAHKGPKKVLVILDGDNGVSIDDCANISRALSKELDESNLIDDNYMLEVSTPGVDQPLKFVRQYRKNIGRKLRVHRAGKFVEGKLTDVSEERIVLNEEVGKKKEIVTHEIPFSEIEKSLVLISFK